jgi:hypothetical protein
MLIHSLPHIAQQHSLVQQHLQHILNLEVQFDENLHVPQTLVVPRKRRANANDHQRQ